MIRPNIEAVMRIHQEHPPTPEAIHNLCDAQIQEKIQAGYHVLLKKTATNYTLDYNAAIREALDGGIPGGSLVLAEPRIPIEDQLNAQGIGIDPSIILPSSQEDCLPYAAWLTFIPNVQVSSIREMVASLEKKFQPATLFEGINLGMLKFLLANNDFASLPGGLTNHTHGVPVLEMYKGKPRVTHMSINDSDALVGILARYRKK